MRLYQVRFATEVSDKHLWFESVDNDTFEDWQQIVKDGYSALEQLMLLEESQKLSWLLGRVCSTSGVPLGRLERVPLSRAYPELSSENQDGLLAAQLERWHRLEPRVLQRGHPEQAPYSWHGNDNEIIQINPANPRTAVTLVCICSSSMGNLDPQKLSQRSLGAWLKHHLDTLEREKITEREQKADNHVSSRQP